MRVGIVGAGPAGLFTAYELAEKTPFEVVVIEQGSDLHKRKHRLHGIGGAGTFSDGKLNIDPTIGGNLLEFASQKEANELLSYIQAVFEKFGVNCEVKFDPDLDSNIRKFQDKAAKSDIEFVPYKTIHVGTDELPKIISTFKYHLIEKGVTFRTDTQVKDITLESGKKYVVAREVTETGTEEKLLDFDALVLASGRSGARWLNTQADKLGLKKLYGAVDVGVRVEVPAKVLEPIIALSYDAKLRIKKTPTYGDFVRTFCTCPNGFVVAEDHDGFVGVNGHSLVASRSENTNFALLSQVNLTEPLEDSNKYSTDMAKLAYDIGGRKPLIQKLGDLEKGRRSTWERILQNDVKPTLTEVTPGDISMALTTRVLTNLKEALYKLDKIVPGVADDSTLLYAPEFKTYALRIVTGDNMETSVPGIFVAGDGPGISRGIVGAAWSGVLAARGISDSVTNH